MRQPVTDARDRTLTKIVLRFHRNAPEETEVKADVATRSKETPVILVFTPPLIKSDDN